jgi:hypothetical protein
MKAPHPQSGFIALISILIISAVLLATTLSLAQFGIANRFFILHLEQKAVSEKLAEACAHIARIQVYNDPAYVTYTATTVPIAGDTCTIRSIEATDDESSIEVQAITGESVTNLLVVVNNDTGDFVSWTEVGAF